MKYGTLEKINSLFIGSCIEGNLSLVKEIYSRNIINKDIIKYSFERACVTDQVDIIKYLMNLPESLKPNLYQKDSYAFIWCLNNKSIAVIDYLIIEQNFKPTPYQLNYCHSFKDLGQWFIDKYCL